MSSSTITTIPMNAQELFLGNNDIVVFDMKIHKCSIVGDKIVVMSKQEQEENIFLEQYEEEETESETESEIQIKVKKPPTITRFDNTDIVLSHDIPISYDPNCTTEKDIIEIAIRDGYPVIVKNGYWYLKGKNRQMNTIKNSINENKGKYSNRVYCLLLE